MGGAHEISASNQQSVSGPTLAWALKRAAMGLVILMVTVTTAACLLYAGIEPEIVDANPLAAGQARQVTVTGTLPDRP